MEQLLHTPEQAAELLGMSRAGIYRMIADRRINSLKIGRLRRLTPQHLREFVEREQATQTTSAPTDEA